jgi:regulator of replication initiation timing
MDWCYDQVHAVRKELGIHSDRCVFTNARGVRETLVGSRFCPAGCLPISVHSELKSEVVAQWLDKTKAFMVPEPTAAIRHYLTEVFQVCTGLVSDPETTLKSLQVSLQEHSGSIVEDNHRLKKENMVLSHKLSDLEVVQRHIVEDNEESQISLRAIHEEMSNLGRKFRQCETAFYELRSHHCDKIQEISSLKHQLDESIHNQWSYYNKLKQHGLIR